MKNNKRELLIGAVSLVKGSVREGGKAMVAVCDALEPEIESSNFLEDAPFDVVSLILRFGSKYDTKAEIGNVNKSYRELEVAFELPMSELREMDFKTLYQAFMAATLCSLIDIGRQYQLPIDRWEEFLGEQSRKRT